MFKLYLLRQSLFLFLIPLYFLYSTAKWDSYLTKVISEKKNKEENASSISFITLKTRILQVIK